MQKQARPDYSIYTICCSHVCRDRIRANGAVLPAADLLQSSSASVRTTAAWALSNFARGPNPRIEELLAAGAGEKAAMLVVSWQGRAEGAGAEEGAAAVSLMTEVAWLLSFLTYNQDEFVRFLASSGCVAALISLAQVPQDQLRIPILRTIGNLACGADDLVDGLLALPLALPCLYQLLQSQHKGLLKETCWTISNIAAGRPEHRQALVGAGFAPLLLHILQTAHFDIRKEAAFAIFHLLMDPQSRQAALSAPVAVEYVGLLRAPDAQVPPCLSAS